MAKTRICIAFILILLLLIFPSTLCFHPVKAQYVGNITITADGTISPSNAPIIQRENVYTLIGDIAGELHISKSNMTFDGNRYTINQYAPTQNQGNGFGLFLDHVYNVTVANTTITNTGNGIYARQQPTAAIYIDYGGSNVIIANNIVNNYNAMSLLESNNNLIVQNNFTNNNNPVVIVSTLMLWGSSNNKIFQNNFVNNNRPAGTASFNSQSSGNSWDNGQEGNFWDDYNGTDTNGDGIGDTPYEIYTKNRSDTLFPKNTDLYPLMAPFNGTFYLLKTTPPKISILSPLNQTYNETSVPLIFTVDKTFSSVTYSLDGKNEAITTNMTLPELPNGNHEITIFVEDTFGNIGNRTIDFIISVPKLHQPFPTGIAVIFVFVGVVIGLSVGLLLLKKRQKPSIETNPMLVEKA